MRPPPRGGRLLAELWEAALQHAPAFLEMRFHRFLEFVPVRFVAARGVLPGERHPRAECQDIAHESGVAADELRNLRREPRALFDEGFVGPTGCAIFRYRRRAVVRLERPQLVAR